MSHLVLRYYQAAAVLWQVADGCWIRLTCSFLYGKLQALLLDLVVTGFGREPSERQKKPSR